MISALAAPHCRFNLFINRHHVTAVTVTVDSGVAATAGLLLTTDQQPSQLMQLHTSNARARAAMADLLSAYRGPHSVGACIWL